MSGPGAAATVAATVAGSVAGPEAGAGPGSVEATVAGPGAGAATVAEEGAGAGAGAATVAGAGAGAGAATVAGAGAATVAGAGAIELIPPPPQVEVQEDKTGRLARRAADAAAAAVVREEGPEFVQKDVGDIIRDEVQEVNGAMLALERDVEELGKTIDIPMLPVPELLRSLSEPNEKSISYDAFRRQIEIWIGKSNLELQIKNYDRLVEYLNVDAPGGTPKENIVNKNLFRYALGMIIVLLTYSAIIQLLGFLP